MNVVPNRQIITCLTVVQYCEAKYKSIKKVKRKENDISVSSEKKIQHALNYDYRIILKPKHS